VTQLRKKMLEEFQALDRCPKHLRKSSVSAKMRVVFKWRLRLPLIKGSQNDSGVLSDSP
jgi:hypothetical protein